VPVLERAIRVRVDVGYETSTFITHNWKWLVGTGVGVAAAVGAVAAAFH
jgi:hypothetical protein